MGVRDIEFNNGYLDLARSLPSVLQNVKKRYYADIYSCPETTCCTPGSALCWVCCLPLMILSMLCCCINPNKCCINLNEFSDPNIFPNINDFPNIDAVLQQDINYLAQAIRTFNKFSSANFTLFNSGGQLTEINYGGFLLQKFIIHHDNSDDLEKLLAYSRVWIDCLKQNSSVVECNVLSPFDNRIHEAALKRNYALMAKYITLVNELLLFVTKNLVLNLLHSIPVGLQRQEIDFQVVRNNHTLDSALQYRHWAQYIDKDKASFIADQWETLRRGYENQIKAIQSNRVREVLVGIEPQLSHASKIILQYLDFQDNVVNPNNLKIDIYDTANEGFNSPTPKKESKFAVELSLLESKFEADSKRRAERQGDAGEINVSRSLILSAGLENNVSQNAESQSVSAANDQQPHCLRGDTQNIGNFLDAYKLDHVAIV